MVIVRAVTIHVPEYPGSASSQRDLIDKVKSLIEVSRKLLSKYSIRCWGFRASFPSLKYVRADTLRDIVVSLSALSRECGVVVAGLHLDRVRDAGVYELLINSLELSDELFGSVLVCDVEQLDYYVECLWKFSSKTDVFTRLAVVFPRRVTTPYFPVSTSLSNLWGVSIALRYADLVKAAVTDPNMYEALVSYVRKVAAFCSEVEARTGIKCLGLDLSLSPWMSESVGEIVELVNGADVPEPGSGWAVFKLNQLISKLAIDANVNVTGFNEVMLPVAEDNLLKKRVAEGKLKVRDLAHLAAYCVAGLDMTAISVASYKKEKLKKILYDTYSLSIIKRRSIGVRLIPSELKPGDVIKSERFGDIPIAYL
ncbi:MAG: DUF711 family protein [Desulfurococcales archaeon]|nr:DUF711 family protein [Desulfurococcales archaeon]